MYLRCSFFYSIGDKSIHIIDYGRGIKEKHFIMNESKEKQILKDKGKCIIGLFGVGLKDSLVSLRY